MNELIYTIGLAMSASKSKLLSLAEFPTGILYHHDKGTCVLTATLILFKLTLLYAVLCVALCYDVLCYLMIYYVMLLCTPCYNMLS